MPNRAPRQSAASCMIGRPYPGTANRMSPPSNRSTAPSQRMRKSPAQNPPTPRLEDDVEACRDCSVKIVEIEKKNRLALHQIEERNEIALRNAVQKYKASEEANKESQVALEEAKQRNKILEKRMRFFNEDLGLRFITADNFSRSWMSSPRTAVGHEGLQTNLRTLRIRTTEQLQDASRQNVHRSSTALRQPSSPTSSNREVNDFMVIDPPVRPGRHVAN